MEFVKPTGFSSGPRRLAARIFGEEGVYDVFCVEFGSMIEFDPALVKKRSETPFKDPDLQLLAGFPEFGN